MLERIASLTWRRPKLVLALVGAFVVAAETLVGPGVLHDGLHARHLIRGDQPLDDDDLRRAIDVRDGLRALALANNGHEPDASAIDAMRRASTAAISEIHVEPDGPRPIVAGADINGAIGALLSITAGDDRRHMVAAEGLSGSTLRLDVL
jgi:putative stress-induced transcription regulator